MNNTKAFHIGGLFLHPSHTHTLLVFRVLILLLGKIKTTMNQKKLEQLVTKTGVGLLLFLTFSGIIFVFDVAFDLDLFSNSMKQAVGILLGLMCVLVVSSVLVSLMLNVSRIANSIEDISIIKTNKKSKEEENKSKI